MGSNSTAHINQTMNSDVAKAESIVNAAKANKLLGLDDNIAYIDGGAFVGNPYALLGSVILIRKKNGGCPLSINDSGVVPEFTETSILGFEIDETSKLKEPIKRQSIVVDQQLTIEVGFLSFLKAQVETDYSLSVMVFDQAAGLIDRQKKSWNTALAEWKQDNAALLADDNICYLFAVIGIFEKYVIYKRYKKFKAGAQGGGYGINVNGELYTSAEDYNLDIRIGLQPVTLKRPADKAAPIAAKSFAKKTAKKVVVASKPKSGMEPTKSELQIFAYFASQKVKRPKAMTKITKSAKK